MPWRSIWMMAVAVTLLSVTAFEIAARSQGHSPMIRDGKDLWAFWREKASDEDPRTVVIIGESKSLMDIDRQTLAKELADKKVLQLAIPGCSPVAVLKDLADDRRFRGVVLCSFIAEELAFSDPTRRAAPEKYVEFYHVQWNAFRRFVRIIRSFFEEHFVLFHPQNIGPKFISHVLRGKKMKVWYLRIFKDRTYQADFTKANIDLTHMTRTIEEKFRKPNLPYSEDHVRQLADEIRESIDKIESRGGRVVLINHVSGGKILYYDEKFFPRDRYWDVFIKGLGVPAVHFADLPDIRRFDCPDWDHLDFRDQHQYTALLAQAAQKKLLQGEKP